MKDKKIDLTKLTKQKLAGQLINEKYGLDLVRIISKSLIPERKSLFDINSEGKILELKEGREITGTLILTNIIQSNQNYLYFQAEERDIKITYAIPNRMIGALCSFHQGGSYDLMKDKETNSMTKISSLMESLISRILSNCTQNFRETLNLWLDQPIQEFKGQVYSHIHLLNFQLAGKSLNHFLFQFNLHNHTEECFFLVISTCHRLRP